MSPMVDPDALRRVVKAGEDALRLVARLKAVPDALRDRAWSDLAGALGQLVIARVHMGLSPDPGDDRADPGDDWKKFEDDEPDVAAAVARE